MREEERQELLNMVKNRPQELCKMCGDCCRVVTTKFTYKELLEKKAQGDDSAIDFLSVFVPFDSIEEAKKESAEIVENILSRTPQKLEDITFYKCKYLRDDNKCGDYEHRPLLCRLNPFSAWSIVPPHCGFQGWLEEQKAHKIQEIKHQKDNLQELNELLKLATNQTQINEINKRINKINEILAFYEKYGSEKW